MADSRTPTKKTLAAPQSGTITTTTTNSSSSCYYYLPCCRPGGTCTTNLAFAANKSLPKTLRPPHDYTTNLSSSIKGLPLSRPQTTAQQKSFCKPLPRPSPPCVMAGVTGVALHWIDGEI